MVDYIVSLTTNYLTILTPNLSQLTPTSVHNILGSKRGIRLLNEPKNFPTNQTLQDEPKAKEDLHASKKTARRTKKLLDEPTNCSTNQKNENFGPPLWHLSGRRSTGHWPSVV